MFNVVSKVRYIIWYSFIEVQQHALTYRGLQCRAMTCKDVQRLVVTCKDAHCAESGGQEDLRQISIQNANFS